MVITLSQLSPGNRGRIHNILLSGQIRNRILDLGFTPGATVKSIRRIPLGDPVAYEVRDTLIALRAEEISQITIAEEELS